MPLTTTFSEEMVRGIAPDEATFSKAKDIAEAKRFRSLGVSSDGSWLLGEYAGAGSEPYHVSADFHDPQNPVLRSNSPSRVSPDKFSLALLLSYLADPNSFSTSEPSDDLLIKREKKIAFDEKKKSGSAAPRKINKSASDKKAAAQREGLELVERELVELVAKGDWFAKPTLEKVEKLAKHLSSDASLPAATFGLRKLLLISKAKDLNEDEKALHGAETIAAVWYSLKKARAILGGETAAEDDAIVEDVLGRALSTAELREKGYFQQNLSLLELAFEKLDDEPRQQRLEVSDLLDLNSGLVHQSIAYRPFKGLGPVPDQTSFQGSITVPEAAVLPGFVNRRIRWDGGSEIPVENPPADLLGRAKALARTDLGVALADFKEQLAIPLAPREAVFFLQPERVGKIGDRFVIADASGVRLELKDRRKDYSHTANLQRALGMLGREKPALLVRFYLQGLTNTVLGLPLAAVTAKHHLRLGV